MAVLGTKRKLHAAHCAICNHERRKEIEDKYLEGESPYQIEQDYPGINHKSVYQHAKIFGLDDKRDNTTLTKVRRLLDRTNVTKVKVNTAMIPRLLELEAKLTGELIERRENTNKNETKIDLSERVQRQVDRIVRAIPGLDNYADDNNK